MGPVRIEVIFDTVCPWCYVGKRRLGRALAMRPDIPTEVIWRPFLLNPDMTEDGMSRNAYLERKFGNKPRVERMLTAVATAGAAENIEFNFPRITCTPNSVRSHRLVAYATEHGRQWEVVEAIFAAYFKHGADIGAVPVLLAIAEQAGLPLDGLAALLSAPLAASQSDNTRAHRLGVNGVPCYIFSGSYAVAGAQEADVLVRLLDLAHEGQLEQALVSA
jgi:predicted DsbA family dithiol-disulfide isomerase